MNLQLGSLFVITCLLFGQIERIFFLETIEREQLNHVIIGIHPRVLLITDIL